MAHQADGAAALELWLRTAPGGYLHPRVHIVADTERGLHWRADEDIAGDTKLITIPHSLALSYLNALVDDEYPVFKQRRKDFTVEAIGFFYLMLQHIHRSKSFWRPYLDTLPSPADTLTTPLWFDQHTADAWLTATDVLYTMDKRKAIYEEYYAEGKVILEQAGVNTSQFSWDYFKWSITMFTSRSFSSKAITPDSKYWTTYKTGDTGQRQTVLLDMSHVSSADLDFSVLFPAIDAGNHNHTTRVHWDYDPGRFSITALDGTKAGGEVYNNYGPKSNAELLQGYGFCVEDNPNDVVLLTVRAPPESLQARLRQSHRGYFDAQGVWLPDKATFQLASIDKIFPAERIFEVLPKPLVELLLLIIRDQRGHVDDAEDAYNLFEMRYRPHIARVLAESLGAKLARFGEASSGVSTLQQRFASMYKTSQLNITKAYIRALQSYNQALLDSSPGSLRLLTLEHVLSDRQQQSSSILKDFMRGIEVNSNTKDLEQLRWAGWEADLWTLLLGFAALTEAENTLPALAKLVHEYDKVNKTSDPQQSVDLLQLVETAAEQLPDTIWASPEWRNGIIGIAGTIAQNDLFQILLSPTDGAAEPALALCVPHAS